METKRPCETPVITNTHDIISKKTEIVIYNAVKTSYTESVVISIADDDHKQ